MMIYFGSSRELIGHLLSLFRLSLIRLTVFFLCRLCHFISSHGQPTIGEFGKKLCQMIYSRMLVNSATPMSWNWVLHREKCLHHFPRTYSINILYMQNDYSWLRIGIVFLCWFCYFLVYYESWNCSMFGLVFLNNRIRWLR